MLLLYVEFHYFLYPGYKFRFAPDSQFTGKLKLNVDLTVAMPCDCKFQLFNNPFPLSWGNFALRGGIFGTQVSFPKIRSS